MRTCRFTPPQHCVKEIASWSLQAHTKFESNRTSLEPFMEWVTRTGNGAEWISGGYGYFLVTGLGAGRITDLRYQDGAKPQK